MKLIIFSLALTITGCSTQNEIKPNEIAPVVESPAGIITDGDFIEYHPNGNVKTKGVLKNGKRIGTWTSYFSNGKVQSENKYKKGVLNGKTAAYYPNGNVQYMGLYINNEKDDSWFFYLEDGTLDKEILFKNGERIKTTP